MMMGTTTTTTAMTGTMVFGSSGRTSTAEEQVEELFGRKVVVVPVVRVVGVVGIAA